MVFSLDMTNSETSKVYDPDVLPPVDERTGKAEKPVSNVRRAERAFGPLLGGVILDFMDLATFGPLGLVVGAVVGFWICSIYRFPLKHKIIGALLAGWYCMMPFTRFIPMATMVGAYARFRESGEK